MLDNGNCTFDLIQTYQQIYNFKSMKSVPNFTIKYENIDIRVGRYGKFEEKNRRFVYCFLILFKILAKFSSKPV